MGQESETRRFACDSNPVVTLLDDPRSRLRKGQTRRGDVGACVDDERITSELNEPQYLLAYGEKNTHPSTGDIGLLPPRPDQEALINIYFHRIHPLLPLLDEDDTRSQFTNGALSLPLLQSICLVASKDRRAVPYLRLDSDVALLPREKFCQRIHKDILEHISGGGPKKRVTTIQILALLSLHEWGPNRSEDCSITLAHALHHAQTIGLHLRKPDKMSGSYLQALFWCLWSLDRWNSAIHGRTIIIHDCDIGQRVTDVIHLFKPPFRIWLLLAHQLGQVIRSYRPMVDGSCEPDLDLSTFEEIVGNSNAWDTSPELLGKKTTWANTNDL